MQAQPLEYFPALERAFDYSRSKAALLLLTKHRTPDGIHRSGQTRLHAAPPERSLGLCSATAHVFAPIHGTGCLPGKDTHEVRRGLRVRQALSGQGRNG